jgi:hypothetical protein
MTSRKHTMWRAVRCIGVMESPLRTLDNKIGWPTKQKCREPKHATHCKHCQDHCQSHSHSKHGQCHSHSKHCQCHSHCKSAGKQNIQHIASIVRAIHSCCKCSTVLSPRPVLSLGHIVRAIELKAFLFQLIECPMIWLKLCLWSKVVLELDIYCHQYP